MKAFFSTLLMIILITGKTVTMVASPAYPGLVQKKQPDGTIVSLYLKGDEKVHWMESEDGYSLLYDNNKSIVYATINEDGDMIPSSIAAQDIALRSATAQAFLKRTTKNLNYSTAQINTLNSIWEISQYTSTKASNQLRNAVGEARVICALINFADKPLVKTKEEFNNLMNQAGYTASGSFGSVNDYYLENSYGKLNLIITVAGPYTVSKKWEYYGENGTDGGDMLARVQEFAKEAAQLTFSDPNIDPTDYDNDNDGYIDAFHIIYAGFGEESGGGANCIWAHTYGFPAPALTFGNKKLNSYSCSPELRGNSGNNITHIGVICHEMCHIFGAPDFYDTDGPDNGGQFEGTGRWDIMASGSWNNNGACPAHINMYQKIQFGWVNPVILNQPQIISGMPNSAMNASAYRYDTSTANEYFILENRQQTGFDKYVPGKGLLIYRVSISDSVIMNNEVNTGHPQRVYPVCASANTNPTGTTLSYGSINSAGCPFPGTSNKTSFTDYTMPSATSWSGGNTLKPLTEIQEQNGIVSFRFLMPDAEPVTNLQVNVENQTNVRLTWNKPSEDVAGYNIYRNNLLLIKLPKSYTSYTQYNVSSGNHNYCVTAVYNNKESAPVCKTAQITNPLIDGNSPTVKHLEASHINGGKDIELSWQSPFVSGWMTHAGKIFTAVYYPGINQFTATARFTTEDIQNFYGSKLSKIRFVVRDTKCKHTIQIWLSDVGKLPAGNPIVSQQLTNPASGLVDVTLNTPVALVSNKDLWIGINYELNPMTFVATIDYGPKVPNRNYVYINNTWYNTAEDDDFNWFISGYLQYENNLQDTPKNSWLRSTTAVATNYVIYRDNIEIAKTGQPHHIDLQPASGSHIYGVSIAYDDEKKSESVCVEATVSGGTALDPVRRQEDEINIFPNPIKKGETLVIHCDPYTDSMLSLYSISGQLLRQEQMTESVYTTTIDFEPGMYLLTIKNASNTFTRKIIIK